VVRRSSRLRAARAISLSFAGAVLAGAGLLMLPWSTAGAEPASVTTALFTAASAVCVTGLVVVDTGTYWSSAGQVIILLLIQLGGLGLMTVASLVALTLSGRLGVRTRLVAQTETRSSRAGDVRRMIRWIVAFSLSFEAVLAAWLTFQQYTTYGRSFGSAVWWGVFHAVSAFNNAGFSTDAASLVPYAGQAGILLPVSLAVIIGGIGFPVLVELAGNWRRPSTWTILTRIVVIGTLALLTVSTLLVLVAEWDNPKTLGPLPPGQSVLTAFVIAVMPRTAGFNAIDMAAQNSDTVFLTQILMLIGGGSAGTAGGIKISTIGVLAFMVWAQARGEQDVNVARRRVPAESQRQAVMVLGLAAATITTGSLIALHLTDLPTEAVVFEVISAFSTVGLSLGITPELSSPVLWLLALLMFIGRTGPVTLAAAFLTQDRGNTYRLPEERTIVG
jgi:potassium uptake TrkH family protein